PGYRSLSRPLPIGSLAFLCAEGCITLGILRLHGLVGLAHFDVRCRLQIFALLAMGLKAKLLLGKLDLGIYLFNACLRLRDLAPGVLNLKLELLLRLLRLGLRLGTAKLNFLLLKSRVGLHLGNLRLGLLHLSLGQPHLSRCKIRVLLTFALLSKGFWCTLNKLIDESVKLTPGPERR